MNNFAKVFIAFCVFFCLGLAGGWAVKRLVSYFEDDDMGPSVDVSFPVDKQPVLPVPVPSTESSPDMTPQKTPDFPDLSQLPVVDISKAKVRLTVGKTAYYYVVTGLDAKKVSESVQYVLANNRGRKYTSRDGKFEEVEACEDGTYSVFVQDLETGLKSEEKELSGFKIVPPVQNRLTAPELERLINTGDYDGCKNRLSGKLAGSVKIVSSGNDFVKSTLQEVFMAVGLEHWKVEVTAVGYNCLGQVMEVKLKARKDSL